MAVNPWQWVQNLIDSDADKPQVVRIEPGHVASKRRVKGPPLKANDAYFRLSVSDIWLEKDFAWGTKMFPGVQSLVRMDAGGKSKTIPAVVGPQTFKLDSRNRQGVATRTQFLTQPIPFRGGTIDTQVALLRVPGESYLTSFMDVLGSFSSLVAAPPLTTALDVADKVTDGLSSFLGLGKAQLHAGIQEAFTGVRTANELDPGYVAVIRTHGAQVSPDNLWVASGGDLRTGQGGKVQYAAHDYMVLHYETSRIRDDWAEIPAIEAPYEAARTQAKLGKTTKARQLIDAAIEAVMTSDDLVDYQKDQIVETLKDIVRPKQARSTGRKRTGPARTAPTPAILRSQDLPNRRELVSLAARREIIT